MRLLIGVLSAGFLLATVCGCGGSDGPDMYAVTGEVSFQGTPIEKGTITFLPADGEGRPDGAEINQGKFKLEATPGKKRIEIRANKKVETPDDNKQPDAIGMETPTFEELIPKKYNADSELTEEVTTDPEKNKFEFKLE